MHTVQTRSSATRLAPQASRSKGRAGSKNAAAARQAWLSGVELARRGDDLQALVKFSQATHLDSTASLYWLNRASVERRLRRVDEAIASARRALKLDSSSELACHLLAEMLRAGNRHAEALEALKALDDGVPRSVTHLMLEGSAQMALRDEKQAAMTFLQVLAQEPGHVEAYMQLGFALASLKRYGDAAECFRTVTLIEPAQFGAAVYAAHYADWACDWSHGPEDKRRLEEARALQKPDRLAPSFSPFCLLSMSDDAALHRQAASWEATRVAREARSAAKTWTPPLPGPEGYPAVMDALKDGRIRLGFVSADFRTHATSMLLVRTLERLDRSRFEVILYSHGADDGSTLRRRMETACDRFVECHEMNLAQQAQRIQDDGVAILFDMSGYTAGSRLGVFALRPAPVQVLWLAYPSTIGGDFIDYVIGDPILTPLEHQEDFTECIAQLPICYEPTDELREHPPAPSRQACGLPEDAFVFACFNQSYKITEDVFSRWCRILQSVPGSVLWLLVPQQEIQQTLRLHATQRGIDPQRLIFAPFVNPEEHLARLQVADLFLDTFPYGAHTTCSDALWMGLPVLTQAGRSFSARVAASLLAAVGLSELTVSNAADYETIAIRLATDRPALEVVRSHLQDNRLNLALFDNKRFTPELEALLLRMVTHWQAGHAPLPIPAAGSAAVYQGWPNGSPQANQG